MTEEESLILVVLNCPEDRTARLVFGEDSVGHDAQQPRLMRFS
jgi:hypothetical protein